MIAIIHSNLEAEMKRKKISRIDLAKTIGCSYRTINSRFSGESRWVYDECVTIRDEYFPDMELNYLFPYCEVDVSVDLAGEEGEREESGN